MSGRAQRLSRVLEMLSRDGHISVAEVSRALGTSAATVRRDLDTLAGDKLLVRTHGGASAITNGYELPLQAKTGLHAVAKTAIALATCGLVQPGDVVGLNGGTTTSEVGRRLARAEHLTPSDGSPGFTLVTSALNIAFELTVRPHVRVVLTGGTVRPRSYELIGPIARHAFNEVVLLDAAVLGVDGIGARFGATTADTGEAEVGRAMAAAAKRVVVVADAAKFSATGPARLLELAAVDVLVTDENPSGELAEALAHASVEVVLAPVTGH